MENRIEKFINDLMDSDYLAIEQAIVDGVLPLKMENKDYRIRTPEFKDKNIAEEEKRKYVCKLINTEGYMFEELLRESLKKKGIDIDALDNEFIRLQEEIKNESIPLALLAKENPEDEDKIKIDEQKNKIRELMAKQYEIETKKYNYLQYSIEKEAELRYMTWLVILCTDVLDETTKEYKRLFKNYEDFIVSEKEELKNKLIYFAMHLFFRRKKEINV